MTPRIEVYDVEMLGDRGVDPGFLARLREALGAREGFDLGWRRPG